MLGNLCRALFLLSLLRFSVLDCPLGVLRETWSSVQSLLGLEHPESEALASWGVGVSQVASPHFALFL